MTNYFPYFTEIEQRFQQRRGSLLMLSTLDWALIETWHEAGVPLEAVLRGIDIAFDRYEQRAARASAGKVRLRKVNGLAWAAQAVMEAAQAATEAAQGQAPAEQPSSGLEAARVVAFLRGNAVRVQQAAVEPEIAGRLEALAGEVEASSVPALETLDQALTALEQRLFAALLLATPEQELVALRAEAARELAPFRSRMAAVQLRQLEQQYLQKQLLQARDLPRLSLFYMAVT